MESFGVDPEKNVFLYQPEEGDQITVEDVSDYIRKIAEKFKQLGIPLLIFWDSLASTATVTELKDNYNNDRMGEQYAPLASNS